AVLARNGDTDPVFYIDGVQQAVTIRQGASRINLYPSTKPLHIGAQVDPTSASYHAKGLIDEVSLYNRMLSTSDVQSIYNAGAAGKCFNHPPFALNLFAATKANQ